MYYGDPDAGYSSDKPKPSPTSSGGNKSASKSANDRYVSTGSGGSNKSASKSANDRYQSTGANRDPAASGYQRYGSTGGGGSTVSYQSTGANRDPAASGYQRYGSVGNTTNVNLGFAHDANTKGGSGIKAIADKVSPVARNLLGMGGQERAVAQPQALASNQLRSGTGNSQADYLRSRWGNIPEPDPYYGAPAAMTVAPTPPMAQRYFDTPLTARAPDGTPNLALQQYIPWDNSGGYPNIDGLNRSDTPDIGPGFGMVGMGRPTAPVQGQGTDNINMLSNAPVRSSILPGLGAMGRAVAAGSGLGAMGRAVGIGSGGGLVLGAATAPDMLGDGTVSDADWEADNPVFTGTDDMDAAAVNATVAKAVQDLESISAGEATSVPDPTRGEDIIREYYIPGPLFGSGRPALPVGDTASLPADASDLESTSAAAPTFYPDVATGDLGFGPEVTGDPNEVAPYYVGAGPSEGMFTKNVGGVDSATLFSELEAEYGLPRGYMNVLWKVESAQGAKMGRPKNAYGHFQFIPSTADKMGLSLEDRTDLTASATAAAQYAAKNMAAIEASMGRPATGADLYLAHQQGTSGGPRLMGSPSRLAKDLVPRKNLTKNILGGSGLNVDTMTAGQFADMWGNKYATYDQALNGSPGSMVNPAPGQFVSPQGSEGLSFGIPEADLATSMVRGYPVANASGGTPTAPASGATDAPSVAAEFGKSYEKRRDIPGWVNNIAGAINPLFGLAGMGINAMGGIPLGDPNNPAERYVSSAQRPNGDSRRDRRGFGEGEDTDDGGTPSIPDDAPPWWPPGVPWPPVAPAPAPGPVVSPYVPTPTTPVAPTPYYFSHPDVSAAGAAGLAGMPGSPWQ